MQKDAFITTIFTALVQLSTCKAFRINFIHPQFLLNLKKQYDRKNEHCSKEKKN